MTRKVNALCALALKVNPNVFDLNYGLKHVSIRDQIVRARMLARDLLEARQIKVGHDALIVGAGAAGLTLASCFAAGGVRPVVVEVNDEPLRLFDGVSTRFVGPFLYEWPSSLFDPQQYPPASGSPVDWWVGTSATQKLTFGFGALNPVSADQLRLAWLAQLPKLLTAFPKIHLLTKVDPSQVKAQIKKWRSGLNGRTGQPGYTMHVHGRLWPATTAAQQIAVKPKLLFLCAGFGTERVELCGPAMELWARGLPFWKDDDFFKPNAGVRRGKQARIAIFGGGDGALQDVLRALTGLNTPLRLLDAIAARSRAVANHLDSARHELASIERQYEIAGAWEAARSPDQNLRAVHLATTALAVNIAARGGVATAVRGAMRSDVEQVHLVVRENIFGKCYALNRFLVLLIAATISSNVGRTGRARLFLHLGRKVASRSPVMGHALPAHFVLDNGQRLKSIDRVAVRFGVDASASGGQQIGLTRRDTQNRRELAEIRLPFWVQD